MNVPRAPPDLAAVRPTLGSVMNVQSGSTDPAEHAPPYPGIPAIMDGSEAIASYDGVIDVTGALTRGQGPDTTAARELVETR